MNKVVFMAMIAVWLKIDDDRIVPALQDARDKLDAADGELLLEFSTVRRVDPPALRAMEELAVAADGKMVKIVLRGVNIDVYKTLKLMKLAARFSFVE